MMKKINNSTCTISIFYDQSLWHFLISNLIKPFLNTEIELSRLRSYSIYLNDDRGDHIELLIKSAEDNGVLKERVTNLVNAFLNSNPSERKKQQEYPAKGVFIDHYNNSFLFEKHPVNFVNDYYADNINERISECIIEALGNEEIEQASMYTFMIYMQLGSIKAAYPDMQDAISNIHGIINYVAESNEVFDELNIQDDSNDYAKELSCLFENNKHILLEILEDVWNPEGYPDEIYWMENWVISCRNFIGKADFNKCYVQINHQVYHHLGFNMDRYILSISSELISNALNQRVEVVDQIINSH